MSTIDVYQSEFNNTIPLEYIGKVKYIGETFGVDGLTNNNIYNVVFDKDNNITSASVTMKADEAKAQEIISLYESKYSLQKGMSDWEGSAQGFDMSLSYDSNDQRIDIDLKKQ